MGKRLQIGDKVFCRYYNTPDEKFVGEPFTATIIAVRADGDEIPDRYVPRDFAVCRADSGLVVTVWRKEIRRRVK